MKGMVSARCTGCGACREVCNFNALTFIKDAKGFIKAIRTEHCVDCGRCTRFCHDRDNIGSLLERRTAPLTYAAWAKNPNVHRIGNSGGLFLTLGTQWIKKGGAVVAVSYDENFVPHFSCARSQEELCAQAWSKFVQSETGTVFLTIKELLLQGIEVMFVGAPCQVKGLYAYLNGDHPRLLTIQFPCIGMPPQWFYQEYIKDFSGHELSDLQMVFGEVLDGQTEKRVMKCVLKNGEVITEEAPSSLYVRAWNEYLIVDDVCCSCVDSMPPVCSDLTIGNFWYIGELEKFEPSREKYKDGCSMLLIHSSKGQKAVSEVANQLEIFSRTYKEAATGHTMFQCPASQHLILRRYVNGEKRASFQAMLEKRDYDAIKNGFFAIKRKKRNAFTFAMKLSKKQKAKIWRFLYYLHTMKREKT